MSKLNDKLPTCQSHGRMMHYITNSTKPNMAVIYFDKLQNMKLYYNMSDSSSQLCMCNIALNQKKYII